MFYALQAIDTLILSYRKLFQLKLFNPLERFL